MNILGWINLSFGLLSVFAGVIVLRGVFQRSLSSGSTVRFLRWSLVASLAGLIPFTHHLTPIQEIGMLTVYCSGAAILAWRKFSLVGPWRRVFAFSVTAVLYLDIEFVAVQLFRRPQLFAASLTQPLSSFQLLQILFAGAFVVLATLAVRKCRTEPARLPALGKLRHTY